MNSWRDADVVFLFDQFYLPKTVAVATVQGLRGHRADEGDLASMTTIRSKPPGVRIISSGHSLRWLKQLALRGRGRSYDARGHCGEQRPVRAGVKKAANKRRYGSYFERIPDPYPWPPKCGQARSFDTTSFSPDLSAVPQLSINASTEQTKAGIREKSTKSGRPRTVALTQLAVEELRRHKVHQAEELLRLGLRQTDEMYVVAQADGQPLKPDSLTHEFVRFIAGTNLPKVRFHDLRHSHATHLLASGVHPKIAQERLGHTTIAITLDLYSHVLPGMQADAASRVDDTLRQALEKHRAGGKG